MDKHNPSPQFQRTFDAERSYSLEEMRRQFNLVEMQADKLAASLLMPPFVINAALKDFNNGNKICIFGDQVLAPEERTKLNKMAAQIGVSFTTLLIRLRQFDMIEYRSLDEYIDSQFIGEVARWKQ